jgi:hypothetical protein
VSAKLSIKGLTLAAPAQTLEDDVAYLIDNEIDLDDASAYVSSVGAEQLAQWQRRHQYSRTCLECRSTPGSWTARTHFFSLSSSAPMIAEL